MSDINSALYTRQASGPALSGSTSGVLASPGLGAGGFLDLLLSAILNGTADPAALGTGQASAAGNKTTATETVPDGLKTESENLIPTDLLTPEITDLATDDQPLLTTSMSPLSPAEDLSALPDDQDGQEDEIALLQGGLLPSLPVDMTGGQPIVPTLTGTGGSPQETPFSGPAANDDSAPAADGLDLTGPLPAETEPTPELAARLNAMTTGGPQNRGPSKTDVAAGRSGILGNANLEGTAQDYNARAGELTTGAGTSGTIHTKAATDATGKTNLQMEMDNALTGGTLADDSLFTIDLSALSPDNWSTALKAAPGGTHGLTHAAATTGNTPAAGIVAFHLQQMAKAGESKTLTVQLDPPELGKVQIRLNLARNRTVQTDIIVEKPETLSMLQKDSNVLRQAMAEAGLETDAQTLNFSLAQDNSGQGGSGPFFDNSGTGPGRNPDAAPMGEIPPAQVWSVDPSSGMKRYNIWA